MAEVVLDVLLMSQERNRWCWAAVASGVGAHLTGAAPIPQCEIAAAVLNQPDCCEDPTAGNVSESVEKALATIRIPATINTSAGFEFAHVVREIMTNRRPICARMVDPGVIEHFVVIVGCDQAAQTVVCADPWGTIGAPAPRYRMPFLTFKNAYGGWGRCTDVCLID